MVSWPTADKQIFVTVRMPASQRSICDRIGMKEGHAKRLLRHLREEDATPAGGGGGGGPKGGGGHAA